MRLRLTTSFAPFFLLPLAVVVGCSSDGSSDGGGGGTGPIPGGTAGQGPAVGGAGSGGRGGSTFGGGPSAGSGGAPITAGTGGTPTAGAGGGTPIAGTGGTSTAGAGGGTPIAGTGGTSTAGAGGGTPTAGAGGSPVGGGGGAPTAGAGGGGTGGAGNPGKWTFAEDPGASCPVGAMPSAGSLMANNKLPDPFKKMDGTAMSSKSEWLCRREEILQQSWEFIYGKKPRTPKDAVSGTVSDSRISVMVNDGGKSSSFNVSVSLPTSGTKPYPAIIGFGGFSGMPVPAGVARITFTPYDLGAEPMTNGGTAPGSGAFYSVYGANHEAGLLVAWAWGVSRILDVLEKNPGTIDPAKIGVTGCSRFGKGAFVAGVMDNRIALTIPVESGVGGTPALRLIEQLDSYSGSEWPYHAISYQQWFSPEKLGQFATANNAGGDNTNKLPVDMHQMMALIAPRGLYIVDNPSTMYNGLDRNSAYATALVGQMIFKALGVGDHITYQGSGGAHCSWRSQYTAPLEANIQKFLLGNASAQTGSFATDLGGTKPTAEAHVDWTAPNLSGEAF